MRRTNMLIAALAAFALASAASAQQQLQMTGEWFSNRGPLIDIPQNGGPTPQSPCNVTEGCIEGNRPADGGVPGAGTATVTSNPGGPATIQIPAGVFNQNKVLTPSTNLLPIVPTVVQLQTNFEVFAPGTEVGPGNLPNAGFADSPDRILRSTAGTNRDHPAFAQDVHAPALNTFLLFARRRPAAMARRLIEMEILNIRPPGTASGCDRTAL